MRVILGEDLPVVGKLTLDEPHGQLGRVFLDANDRFADRYADFVFAPFDDLPGFDHALLGQDHVRPVGLLLRLDLFFDECQSMSVAGHHAQFSVRVGLQEYAAQVQPRFVRGGREQGFFDHLAQRGPRQLYERFGRRCIRLGFVLDARKLLGIEAGDLKPRRATSNDDLVVSAGAQTHLPGRQLAHDLVQLARAGSDRAGVLDLGGALLADADFQVGRGQRDPGGVLARLSGRDQDVRQDGKGGAVLHHALNKIQTLDQFVLVDVELHSSPVSVLWLVTPCLGLLLLYFNI